MHFENIKHSDLEDIKLLQPEGWRDIVPQYRFYLDASFCSPVKAISNNAIVGIGTAIFFENTAWLAHIIVDKNHRKQGIGYQIVEELLAVVKSKSIETCLLISTELGYPVYKKAGFRDGAPYSFFKKEQPNRELPVPKNIKSGTPECRADILNLDQKITGENRTNILKYHLNNSILNVVNQRITGFYLPDLGEGPICALTQEAGFELMQVKYASIKKASLPADNKAAIHFLKKSGFRETNKSGMRMIHGKDISWHPEMIFSRIGGNFG